MRKLFPRIITASLVLALGLCATAQRVKPTELPKQTTGREEDKPGSKNQNTLDPERMKKPEKDEKLERYEKNQRATASLEIFPSNTVWVNTDFAIATNLFDSKLMLVVISDFNCEECAYYISSLEEELKMTPAYQIIEVIKVDTLNPVSRNFVLQYVQQNSFSHPVAVVAEYPSFGGTAITEVPTFLLYQKGRVPDYVVSGASGFGSIREKIKSVSTNKAFLQSCNAYQAQPAIMPQWWADPVIENPNYIAVDNSAGVVYVNDAAHNRIVELDGAGNCTRTIGSSYFGFADDVLSNSKFDHPHGMCFYDGKLYIADTHNHRVRAADIAADRVRTVLGNGQYNTEKKDLLKGSLDAIALPIDIIEWNGKLYVASAATNRIFELDPKTGEAKKFADIPATKDGLQNVSIRNLAPGKTSMYAILSNGSYVMLDKKGTALTFTMPDHMGVSSIAEWDGELVASTDEGNAILLNGKEGWKKISGTGRPGDINGDADFATYNKPTDIALMNGELIIADRENHRLRKLNATKNSKARNYAIVAGQEIVVEMAAHTEGEMVVMDTVFVGPKESTVNVMLDLGEYAIVEAGRNEADINEIPGVSITDYAVKNNQVSFKINNKFPDYDVYLEVYLLLENPAHPGVYVAKRSYLAFVIARVDNAPAVQEQIYRPNLLPY